IETSVMLALAPDQVRVDRLQAGVREPISTLMARLRTDGLRAVSPSGVLGDPRGAEAAIGSDLLDRWTSALLAVIDGGPDTP
ncbi:MAG: creatininase family protein, partial [Actinomycetota bacterium]